MKFEKAQKSSKKSELNSTILALDIGTNFVKCVLASPVSNNDSEKVVNFRDSLMSGKLRVLGVSRAAQDAGSMDKGTISDIPSVAVTAEQAINEVETITGERAKLVVVGLSGELVKSDTTTIRYRRDCPNKPITDSELRELLGKIESRAKEKVKSEASLETDNPEIDLSLINSAMVSLSIDGYKINNPVGFKGAEVMIEYYTAFAPTLAVSAIEKVCVELELDLLAIAASPFAVSRACLGDDVSTDFSAILLDIGGGTTDVAIIDSGEICGTKTFDIAGENFTRQISESLGVRTVTAEKYKVNLENEDVISDAIINKTTGALNQAVAVWLAGLEIALEDFKNVSPFPKDILLSGGSANLLPLQEALATSDWFSGLEFEERPLINVIDPANLPDFVFFDNPEEVSKIDSSFLAALGLLRVAVDTLLVSPESKGIRAKIAKLLSH